MSQSPKKPGARDISDLKARLGLKKGGSPAKKPAGGPAVPPPAGGGGGGAIPAPTAAKAAVPAPPGTAEAQKAEQAAAIPDARQDPFGAMNAMAAQNVAAAAPEIVVVNDGKPVESVGKKSKVGLLKAIVPAVAALVVGMVVGQMGTKASIYNETIDDAAVVGEAVKKVDKQLQTLRDVLYTAKERGAKNNYLVADEKLTAELEALTFELPDLNKVYESNLYNMDQGVVDQTLSYLTEASLLQKQLKDHVLKAKSEAKALAAGKGRIEKFGLPTRYGIIVQIPKGDEAATTPVSAMFVEIGDPVCQDGKPNPMGCGEGAPKGFMYRPAEMGPWGQKDLATPEEGYIKGNRLIPLGVGSPSPTLKALFFGGESTVSEVTYMKRITEIDAKVDDLMERGKNLRKAFTAVSNQSKQFTFFM